MLLTLRLIVGVMSEQKSNVTNAVLWGDGFKKERDKMASSQCCLKEVNKLQNAKFYLKVVVVRWIWRWTRRWTMGWTGS